MSSALAGIARNIAKLTIWSLILLLILSRFFTETLGVLPKIVDVINYVVFFIALLLLIVGGKRYADEKSYIVIFVLLVFSLVVLISSFVNLDIFYLPVTVLFLIGFLEGPLIFLVLNQVIGRDEAYTISIEKLFVFLFVINVVVVVVVSYPLYIASGGNPDMLSGTFGKNAYYFSVFLVIIGGWFFGREYSNSGHWLTFYLVMGFVFGTFFLLQYRAALPFFVLSFLLLGFILYGRRIVSFLMVLAMLFITITAVLGFLKSDFDNTERLKYGDWAEIIENPLHFTQFGKFQAYPETFEMYSDYLPAMFIGVGPGNYTSRAYYTFGYEFEAKDGKGVSKIIKDYLGQETPRYTSYDLDYLSFYRSQIVFGSYQLSNPNSSFVTLIGEVGLFGGGLFIFLYIWLLKLSFENLKSSRKNGTDVAIAAAAFSGTVYVFCLAFLDNYWEMSRATIVIWSLNWLVCTRLSCRKSVH